MLKLITERSGHASRLIDFLTRAGYAAQQKLNVVLTSATHEQWRQAVPPAWRTGVVVEDYWR